MLDPGQGRLNLAPLCDILEDPGGGLDLAQVSSPAWAERFRPHIGQEVDIGHSTSAWWLRFRLLPPSPPDGAPRPTPAWWLEIGKPGLDFIDLHIPTARGWVTKQSGAMRGPEAREVLHRTYVLDLPDDFISDGYCYLRVASNISLNFPLQLWRPDVYVAWTVADFFAFGVAYGVMLAMIVFNLFLYLSLRHRSYLLYIIYITSMLIHLSLLYGQAPAFLNLGHGLSLTLSWITVSIAWLSAGAFSRGFLETKRYSPKLDKCILLAMLVNIFLASPALHFAISVIGVIVFVGLTAYDTQQIKEMYYEGDGEEIAAKKSIMGALRLYLDFINIFIMLMQLFGERK